MSLETLQANLAKPQLCPNPIFVIGSPRSGTHGLAFSLGTHSQLCTHSESEILYPLFGHDPVEDILQAASKRVLPTWIRMQQISKAEFYGFLGIGINALFTSRNPDKRWIDKTPQYALMGEVLAQLFPGAQFLHIVRDGRRVVHSMIRFLDRFNPANRQAILESGHLASWATDFRTACRTWREYTEKGSHFCSQYPQRCLTVVNEQLVAEPDKGFDGICRFLDVPVEKGPVEFFRNYRVNSSFQQARPDLPTSENLARPFQDWTLDQSNYFLDQQPYQEKASWREWPSEWKELFLEEAGETMVRLKFSSWDELNGWREASVSSPESVEATPGNKAAQTQIQEIQTVAAAVLPIGVAVLVVMSSGGEVPRLPDRLTFRYPSCYLPADSNQAITHLESFRQKGAGFLLFPAAEFGWFDRYPEFHHHLETNFRCIHSDSCCKIFQLR